VASSGSVTFWVGQLKDGDAAAAQKLWERYFHRLVGLARTKIHGAPRRMADEEDVALSAFDSFCRGAENGRFPRLTDRDDLWRLLVVITVRKALDHVIYERRQKRGGGAVLGESALLNWATSEDGVHGMEQVLGSEPTPVLAAQLAEEFSRLLDCLQDAQLRLIALWKMEGQTVDDIAQRLGCVPRTVERKLRLIRSLWAERGGA
jgi:DNA-directed RNA polymerase specialized sigma24 family protein